MKKVKKHTLKSLAAVAAAAVTAVSFCGISAFAENNSISETAVVSASANENQDNEELVLDYIDHYVFECSAFSFPAFYNFSPKASTKLNAAEKAIYDQILEEVKNIAAGTRTSTEITFTCSLPVGTDTPTMTTNIINCLLNDCPYELYWYDKTISTSTSLTGAGSTYTGGKISFPVSSDYGSGFSVDPAKTGAVATAKATVSEIIAKYAGKSDYEKLVGYKDEICALTEYNNAAAADPLTPYGNPWQFIWVFDKDTSTNVVCEGYSKAFKYLCDMTAFDTPVYCYTVSGSMGGPHMWNIVDIGGECYHVDVTNCDTGAVGAPDKLFLKGVTSPTSSGFSIIGKNYSFDADSQSMYDDEISRLSTEDYVYVPRTLAGIAVAVDSAHKKAYTIGDAFDPAGLKITLTYSDSTSADVEYAAAPSEFSFSPSVFTAAGNAAVTVTYKGKTVDITDITVKKKAPAASDFTFTAPADLTFDGNAKSASVVASAEGMGNITVKYMKDGEYVSEPVETGTYKVLIDAAEGTVYSAASDITAEGWTFTVEAGSEIPVEPEVPDVPVEPEEPETPEEPERPTNPENPDVPERPAKPVKPTEPETPAEPEKPAVTEKPVVINYPVVSGANVLVDKQNAVAGEKVNVNAGYGYDIIVTAANGKVIARLTEKGSFIMPASRVTITVRVNEAAYHMDKCWNHSYVYSYDSDMDRIKTSTDKKRGIVVIDLGTDYAGKNFTIYSGRKSTEKKIISGTLDKNGRYKFSSSVGRNYTLVIE